MHEMRSAAPLPGPDAPGRSGLGDTRGPAATGTWDEGGAPLGAPPPTPPRSNAAAWLLGLALSGLFHLWLWENGAPLLASWSSAVFEAPVRISVIDEDGLAPVDPDAFAALDPLPPPELSETPPEPEEVPPPPPLNPNGQVVDIAPPDVEQVPEHADYLASYDQSVPEETRTQRFKVNPDVLSNTYSRESAYRMEDLQDVGATEVSTGAMAGGTQDEAPGDGPPRSPVASQFLLTNKEGLAAPTVASSRTQALAGAPQNDLLREKVGPQLSLNTREYAGASYLNRIRAMVNFYWDQNLDNLPTSVVLSSPEYTTVVAVKLNSAGGVEDIQVTRTSGVDPLDLCVTKAFLVAQPFPNPPAAMVDKDGFVRIDDMGFTVQVGRASMQYQGIDPRAGVQFPGIMRAPR